ncbi:3'-5' ssDNA/RNA exonuclease TatD-like [Crassostrea angulata]|uniref:3'-5' ssDNA/RNA exonuclease TatD-like n=1 Tax=Magallana angulata TaxID=2784310 RepID=UPI0022B21897|nr:3'-5' ssDNA/RNA exonuclease TatD-like [Crassostrea angulata]
MRFYSAHYSTTRPAQFSVSPMNHIACVLHWQVISTVLRAQTVERQVAFQSHQCRLLTSGMTIDKPLRYEEPAMLVDSHFHLDKVLGRSGYTNWDDLQRDLQGRGHLELVVSFGLHPHVVCDAPYEILDKLGMLASLPQWCAIGEAGVDLTKKCHCSPCGDPHECRHTRLWKQLDFLSEALQIARSLGKPVILHCRDDGSEEAAAQTLPTIQMMDRSDHVFHLHCFTGEAQELRQWQKKLPHTKFGVTMKSIQDPRTVALIPPERLLLETEAPYLPPAPRCRLNHPWNVLSLAKQVAFIRNTPPSLLLKVANANAMDIYGCP